MWSIFHLVQNSLALEVGRGMYVLSSSVFRCARLEIPNHLIPIR